MIQLGIIDADFPQLGAALGCSGPIACQAIGNDSVLEHAQMTMNIKAECGCLKRQLPPSIPDDSLPFPTIPENRAKMKQWLLERYATSTCNKCPHQILPTMDGPPIQVHLLSYARPANIGTPAPVSLHLAGPDLSLIHI